MTLKFSNLANFKPTGEPTDFKVGVYKGTAVEKGSTIEITVEIACGDAKASKAMKAVEGEASFEISEFIGTDKIAFDALKEGDSCTATATGADVTKATHTFKATDDTSGGGAALTIDENGKITAPAGSKVGIEGCDTYLVKWTGTEATMAVANKDAVEEADKLVAGDIYLAGTAAGCTVSAGEHTLSGSGFDDYTPATPLTDQQKEVAADGFTLTGNNKAFQWFATDDTNKASASVAVGAAAGKVMPSGFTNTWKVWILMDGKVQKIN